MEAFPAAAAVVVRANLWLWLAEFELKLLELFQNLPLKFWDDFIDPWRSFKPFPALGGVAASPEKYVGIKL